MAYAIAIFVGGVLGAASESVFGLFVGGLLGWLLVRMSRLQRDINALRASLGEARVADAAPAAAASVSTAEPGVAAPALAASEARNGDRACVCAACRADRASTGRGGRGRGDEREHRSADPAARRARRRGASGSRHRAVARDAAKRPSGPRSRRRLRGLRPSRRCADGWSAATPSSRPASRSCSSASPSSPSTPPSTPRFRSSGGWRESASPRWCCSPSAGGCACRGPATRRSCRAARSRCST